MSICLLFLFLSVSEAEPLDLGSQALGWEPVKKTNKYQARYFTKSGNGNFLIQSVKHLQLRVFTEVPKLRYNYKLCH